MNTKLIKCLLVMALVVATALTVCSCGGGVNSIITMLDNGQYTEAITFVDENQIPSEVLAELEPQLKERLDNVVKNYAEETITYTQAQDIGFGVIDPARDGLDNNSSIIYNGSAITIPTP